MMYRVRTCRKKLGGVERGDAFSESELLEKIGDGDSTDTDDEYSTLEDALRRFDSISPTAGITREYGDMYGWTYVDIECTAVFMDCGGETLKKKAPFFDGFHEVR